MAKARFHPVSNAQFLSNHTTNILMNDGLEGHQIYMFLMQFLANVDDRVIPLSEIPKIAYRLRITPERVAHIVNSYMIVENNCFYCLELEAGVAAYFDKVSRLNASKDCIKKYRRG